MPNRGVLGSNGAISIREQLCRSDAVPPQHCVRPRWSTPTMRLRWRSDIGVLLSTMSGRSRLRVLFISTDKCASTVPSALAELLVSYRRPNNWIRSVIFWSCVFHLTCLSLVACWSFTEQPSDNVMWPCLSWLQDLIVIRDAFDILLPKVSQTRNACYAVLFSIVLLVIDY